MTTDPRDTTATSQTGEWKPIGTAPVNTPVSVRLGKGMVIVARLVPDASMTTDEKSCDQWQAEYEGEHPECWSDGCCWESNADECMSLQPRAWLPVTPQEKMQMADDRHIAFAGKPLRMIAEHDELCGTRRGYTCNCPLAAISPPVPNKGGR